MSKYKTGGRFEKEGTIVQLQHIFGEQHINTHDRQSVFKVAFKATGDMLEAKRLTDAFMQCPSMIQRANISK